MTWQETLAKHLGLGSNVDQEYLADVRDVLDCLSRGEASGAGIALSLHLGRNYTETILSNLAKAGLVEDGTPIGRLWKSAMSETLKRDVIRALRRR